MRPGEELEGNENRSESNERRPAIRHQSLPAPRTIDSVADDPNLIDMRLNSRALEILSEGETHENPVKAGIVATPQAYAGSSDRHYRRGRGSKWVDVDRLLPMLGRGRSAALRGYQWLMRGELEAS
jgi:hypothetical protein